MKRFVAFLLLPLLTFSAVACAPVSNKARTVAFSSPPEIGITWTQPPLDFERGQLKRLPSSGRGRLDLRSFDLSQLSLEGRLDDLLSADFDSATKWPDPLPDGFNPDEIMELGKDPGLKLRTLHAQGITGKGVGIAIIDQGLLVDHIEYKDRLLHYEELHYLDTCATMHGAAVASIAVGKSVGVAPEADLYYIAETHGTWGLFGGFNWDFTWLAKCVDRVIEINETLPTDKQIRVLAMQIGWQSNQKGYSEVVDAVERAKASGIFVVSSSLYETYDHKLYFHGLGRSPYADPNDPNSYGPGMWWASSFFAGSNVYPIEPLLIPMDARCTASPTGPNDYVYYTEGGWSWSIPYIAGLYALACQVDPNITPEKFWATGLATGDTVEVSKGSRLFTLGKIINPAKLIEVLSTQPR